MIRSDLLEVVYRFYPRGLLIGTDGYNGSEERYRQQEAARRGAAEYPTWKAMLRRLEARHRIMDQSLSLLAGWYDAGYSGEIEIPGHTLGFHVSLLGPYYGIHRTGAPGEEPAALDLALEIEATYPGYEPIPRELGNEVVPDVVNFGKSTIYDCLLSDTWKWSSGPDDAAPLADARTPDPAAPDAGSDPSIPRRSHGRVGRGGEE